MRNCIFCGERASTKEDAWPLWLVRRLPTPHGVRIEARRRGKSLEGWKALRHGITVRFVCAECNNGWMSQLETRAKPVVEKFLDEPQFQLSREEQSTLAIWMAKNAMVFEALRGHRVWFYDQDEREALRLSRTIPARTTVWLAKCLNLPGAYCSATDHSETARQGPDETRLYVTTMAFGKLALQVATARLAPALPPDAPVTVDVTPGPWEQCTLSTWPTPSESLAWPPQVDLVGELGVEAFHSRWGKDSDEPTRAAV